MAEFQKYALPTSLAEAVALLREGGATLLAGGTDLMPQSQAGVRDLQPLLVNITRLPELKGLETAGETIRIGALATVGEILESPVVKKNVPVLAAAADCFASVQLRNWATVGGNIVNASPAGDMIIPLLLLDAELELVSQGDDGKPQSRRMALEQFFTGPGKTRLEPHEILAAIHLPIPPEPFVASFIKLGQRPALDISAVSLGIAGLRENGGLANSRVAMGAVAPTPLRARGTEQVLNGRPLDPAGIEAVAAAAGKEIKPISDVRASAWYRTEMVINLTKRMLHDVANA